MGTLIGRWLALALAFAAPAVAAEPESLLLRPDRVFDGVDPVPHAEWEVLVTGDRIVAVGPKLAAPAGARVIALPGQTLMPGMIEGHGHLFLHPYDETSWDDQVLHEPLALRTARAVAQARATLLAGFTSERDLGTEGAGYADVGLKQAIDQGIVPGPRLTVAAASIGDSPGCPGTMIVTPGGTVLRKSCQPGPVAVKSADSSTSIGSRAAIAFRSAGPVNFGRVNGDSLPRTGSVRPDRRSCSSGCSRRNGWPASRSRSAGPDTRRSPKGDGAFSGAR